MSEPCSRSAFVALSSGPTFRPLSVTEPPVRNSRASRLLAASFVVTNIGTFFEQVAAAWLVYKLTDSAAWVGFQSFAVNAPTLLTALPAGAWADRWNRRKALLRLQIAWTGLAALMALLSGFHLLTGALIVIITALEGIIAGTSRPFWNATSQDIVGRDLVDDRLRRAGGRKHRDPGAGFGVGDSGLRERRHIGQRRRTRCAAHGQCLQLAGLDMTRAFQHGCEQNVHVPSHQVGHRRATALVRHVGELDACRTLKDFGGQVRRAALAGAGVGTLARLSLGQCNEFFRRFGADAWACQHHER